MQPDSKKPKNSAIDGEFKRKFDMQEAARLMEGAFFTASASDCTGLIPSAPVNDAELASYQELQQLYPADEAK